MDHSTYHTCAVKPQIKLSEWDILSSLPNALVILDTERRVVWLNPLAEAMLGYGLIDTLWQDIIQRAFVPHADDGHEISLADGRRVHLASAVLASLPGMLVTLSDITASRDFEKAKEHEKRLVEIGTMTAQLAHQIRTPLSSAILYTDHLNILPDMSPRTKNWISRIQECHVSIEQQIQDLLLFARGAAIETQTVAMQDWCAQLISRAQPYVESYSAQLRINNLLKTTKSTIHGESLIGAVLNLVINALQANATEIEITLASTDYSGIQLTVEDNGKGMSAEVKALALSPFFTTKAQGTGLGLAVVFAVVKAHNGRVLLESVEGEGTQVTLYLLGEPEKTIKF